MFTVLEALKKTTEYLEKKGIESPRVNAEIMLAHVLKCKRLQLYLSFDRPLDENEKNLYRKFLLTANLFNISPVLLNFTD